MGSRLGQEASGGLSAAAVVGKTGWVVRLVVVGTVEDVIRHGHGINVEPLTLNSSPRPPRPLRHEATTHRIETLRSDREGCNVALVVVIVELQHAVRWWWW